jgi:hypothetical protein
MQSSPLYRRLVAGAAIPLLIILAYLVAALLGGPGSWLFTPAQAHPAGLPFAVPFRVTVH